MSGLRLSSIAIKAMMKSILKIVSARDPMTRLSQDADHDDCVAPNEAAGL